VSSWASTVFLLAMRANKISSEISGSFSSMIGCSESTSVGRMSSSEVFQTGALWGIAGVYFSSSEPERS